MALDIYIMPLHKFFSGDYTSPRSKKNGINYITKRNEKGQASTEDAEYSVTALQEGFKQRLLLDYTWHDEGVTIAEPFDYDAYNGLRAFAAHQDYPKKKGLLRKTPIDFDPSENFAMHPGIKKIWKGADSQFQHTAQHAIHQGFWIPIDFKHPVFLN